MFAGLLFLSCEDSPQYHVKKEIPYEVKESKSNAHDERNVSDSDDSYKTPASPHKRKLLEAPSDDKERYYDNDSHAGGGDVTSAVHFDDHSPIIGDAFFSEELGIRKVNSKTKHDDTDFTNGPGGVFYGYRNAGTIMYPSGEGDDDVEALYDKEDDDVRGEQDYVTNDNDEAENTRENATDRLVPSEQRLVSDLLWSYERAVRPVANASTTVHVDIDLTVTQIFDLVTISHIYITFSNNWYQSVNHRPATIIMITVIAMHGPSTPPLSASNF